MPHEVLYAYVDGSDLENVEVQVEAACSRFLAERGWGSQRAFVVNQRAPVDGTGSGGDLPDWELGLNVALTDDQSGDLQEIETIARFVHDLAKTIGREFVIGVAGPDGETAEDVIFIGDGRLDLETLRNVFARRPA